MEKELKQNNNSSNDNKSRRWFIGLATRQLNRRERNASDGSYRLLLCLRGRGGGLNGIAFLKAVLKVAPTQFEISNGISAANLVNICSAHLQENCSLMVPWVLGFIGSISLEALAVVYSNILRDHVNQVSRPRHISSLYCLAYLSRLHAPE